jgi:hypothetical protein
MLAALVVKKSLKNPNADLQAGNGSGPYVRSRQGQRIARKIVAKLFPLEPGHVVHHEDRNAFNNEPFNLKVFQTQGDHTRYHRGFEVEPLWDGAK